MAEYPMEIAEGLKQCFVEMTRARAKALTLCNKQHGDYCNGDIPNCIFRVRCEKDASLCLVVFR